MNDDEREIRISISREALEAAMSTPPDPARLEMERRLKHDPGTVVSLDSWLLDDGREVFSAALDCIPAGTVHHLMSQHYPRIVGALKAQGCRVRPDSLLTLVSSWELED